MELYDYQKEVFEKITTNPDTRQRVTIVGDHGVGKTTLLKVLQKHYKKNGKTTIFLDGQIIGEQATSGLLFIAKALQMNVEGKDNATINFTVYNEMEKRQLGDKLLILLDEMDSISYGFGGFLRGTACEFDYSLIAARAPRPEFYFTKNQKSTASPLDNILGNVFYLKKPKT